MNALKSTIISFSILFFMAGQILGKDTAIVATHIIKTALGENSATVLIEDKVNQSDGQSSTYVKAFLHKEKKLISLKQSFSGHTVLSNFKLLASNDDDYAIHFVAKDGKYSVTYYWQTSHNKLHFEGINEVTGKKFQSEAFFVEVKKFVPSLVDPHSKVPSQATSQPDPTSEFGLFQNGQKITKASRTGVIITGLEGWHLKADFSFIKRDPVSVDGELKYIRSQDLIKKDFSGNEVKKFHLNYIFGHLESTRSAGFTIPQKAEYNAVDGPIEVGKYDFWGVHSPEFLSDDLKRTKQVKLNNIPLHPLHSISHVLISGLYTSPSGKIYQIEQIEDICNSGFYEDSDMRYQMNCWLAFDQGGFKNQSNKFAPYSRNDGPCPFAFTKNINGTDYQNRGQIMMKLEGKDSERLQIKTVPPFDGNLKIKELEDEISYINYIALQLILKNGERVNIPPDNDLLKEDDKRYLILNKGEEIHLRFNIPDRSDIKTFRILNKGYYDSLSSQ